MYTIFRAHHTWSQSDLYPKEKDISKVILQLHESLMAEDQGLVVHLCYTLRTLIFDHFDAPEAQEIIDETVNMDHPNDVKYERIEDDSIQLAKVLYGMCASMVLCPNHQIMYFLGMVDYRLFVLRDYAYR